MGTTIKQKFDQIKQILARRNNSSPSNQQQTSRIRNRLAGHGGVAASGLNGADKFRAMLARRQNNHM